MRYATEQQIHDNLTVLLSRIAPGFTLMHFRAEPNHNEMEVTVCAKQGLNRLMFRSIAFPTLCVAGQFQYIGVSTDCDHRTGINRRVQMLMRVHPNAHIRHADNGRDDDEALFGFVAYDDNFVPLAWAPLPLDDDGMAMDDEPARITHTMPAGLDDEMEYIKGVEGEDPDNIV